MNLRDEIALMYEGVLFLQEPYYDPCILGVAERFGGEYYVAYSKQRVIRALCAQGMDYDEACEWFSYNTIGAWVGDHTPIFIDEDFSWNEYVRTQDFPLNEEE
jgi:hypothetical protein